ncbi:pyruvate kinase 1, cytosolic isoform X1 [Triticum aestivum]|uniref:pyruvate kinase 1, cytosolic isoform X1 n=1 Tax=Triticum aestivum TaxID=4565 RepID=UPI001D014776|nr:pyruvate kinase 1, cytosolic-like isoform X1 [Triticum aestivum]
MPTLSDEDKDVMKKWGAPNKIDFLSFLYKACRRCAANATDVANAVLDGNDAILLCAETLCGLYPVETISTIGRICDEAEKVFNQDLYFKRTMKYVGEPMIHLESIASSAVRAAIKANCQVQNHHAIPHLKTNQLKWSFTSAFEARQSLNS